MVLKLIDDILKTDNDNTEDNTEDNIFIHFSSFCMSQKQLFSQLLMTNCMIILGKIYSFDSILVVPLILL